MNTKKSVPPKESVKTGPHPERVKLNTPWEKAVGDALKKKRPEGGWPKPEKSKDEKKKA